MGLWGFYFLAKCYLYYKGHIQFHLLWNALFATLLSVPVPEKYRYKALMGFRFVLFASLAVALLWYDSWLSSPFDAVTFLSQQGVPSKEYLLSFALGFFSIREAGVLAGIFGMTVLANKFLKMTPIVAGIFIVLVPYAAVSGIGAGDKLGQTLESFYDYESTRMVRFKKAQGADTDFDVVVLHVCSLSYDDIEKTNFDSNPFFTQFNLMLTNFNTATSYSGPAIIRLLRANCGQPRHADLYVDAPKDCYTFETLASRGYSIGLAMNHDGVYGNFAEDAKRYGHIRVPPMKNGDLPAEMYMFDNSPIYGDYRVLERWWRSREQSGAKRAALYYNTVTLHDGTHWAGEKKWFQRDRKEQYVERLARLFDDMKRFFELLSSSGRNVVVIFVPEHGMALSGSKIQAMGLRDVPLPQITRVPVGIKLIGPKFNGAAVEQRRVGKSTSYMALAYALSSFVEKNPFGTDWFKTKAFTDAMPQTDMVSENLGMLIMRDSAGYYLYGKEKKWIGLTETELR